MAEEFLKAIQADLEFTKEQLKKQAEFNEKEQNFNREATNKKAHELKLLKEEYSSVTNKAVMMKIGLVQSEIDAVCRSKTHNLGEGMTPFKYAPWQAVVAMVNPLLGKNKVLLETIILKGDKPPVVKHVFTKTYKNGSSYEKEEWIADFFCTHKFIDSESGEFYCPGTMLLAFGKSTDGSKAQKAALSNEKSAFLVNFFNIPVEEEAEFMNDNKELSRDERDEDRIVHVPAPAPKVEGPKFVDEALKTTWFETFKKEVAEEYLPQWMEFTKPPAPDGSGQRRKTSQLTVEMAETDLRIFAKTGLAGAFLMFMQEASQYIITFSDKAKFIKEEIGVNSYDQLDQTLMDGAIKVLRDRKGGK